MMCAENKGINTLRKKPTARLPVIASIISLSIGFGITTSAVAADFTWDPISCSSNFFETTSCWGGATPGIADNALLDQSGIYTITFDSTALSGWNSQHGLSESEITNNQLTILNGNATLKGSGITANNYRLTGDMLIDLNGVLNIGTLGTMNVFADASGTSAFELGKTGAGSLNIISGSTLSNDFVYMAVDTGSSGAATVDGTGSDWTINKDLVVGDRGNATLNIQNQGNVSVASGATTYIGSRSGSVGAVTVDGAGSNLSATSTLIVGNNGTGSLTISNGGTVSLGDAKIGTNAGSYGTATVNGIGSSWVSDVNGRITVGDAGTGTLTIENGGVVNFGYGGGTGIIVGDASTANGSIVVNGTGSELSLLPAAVGSLMIIGHYGTGDLTVENGGDAINDDVHIGYQSGSTGTATIDGSGSSWSLDDLYVGRSGAGTLNIVNGADVTSTSSQNYIALATGSSGTMIVGGAGSSFTSNGLIVGGGLSAGGNGTLDILNGGLVDTGSGALLMRGPGTTTVSGGTVNTSGLLIDGALNILAGSQVTNTGSATWGFTSGTNGIATVDGVGANWTNDGDLDVGSNGNGTLNIVNGGSVTSTNGMLGDVNSANGTVNVSGSGSNWTNANVLTVGNYGSGTMNITTGGTVTYRNLHVGLQVNSTGTVNIDGTGSELIDIANSPFVVGNAGQGILNILNGGKAGWGFTTAVIGNASTGNGSVLVDGTGSRLGTSGGGDLTIGQGGTGSLTIQNGGYVSDHSGKVGTSTGSAGTVTVDGVGSTWSNVIQVVVGNGGTGELNILNGGYVYSANSGSNSYIYNGSATIDGAGSSWAATNLSIGGTASSGALNVQNSGLFDASDTLNILGAGTLNISGGTVNATIFSNTGLVNFNGGTINASSFVNDGTFNFNAGSLNLGNDLVMGTTDPLGNSISLNGFKSLSVAGTTSLTGFSSLSLDGGTFSTGSLVNNGGFAFNSGTFNLTNDNLVIGAGGLFGGLVQFDYGQTVNVSNVSTVNAGAVLALNNAAFSSGVLNNNGQIHLDGFVASLGGGILVNTGMLTGSGQVSSILDNSTGGEVRVNSGDALTFTASASNTGLISLLGGSVDFTQNFTNYDVGVISGRGSLSAASGLNNQGAINLSSGNTDIFGDVNNTGAGAIIVSGNGTATFYDDVVHNGSEIRVSDGSSAVFFGTVSGSGSYTGTGSVFFEGTVLPGNSPGLVNVEGDLNFGVNSNTFIELGGLLLGDEYDAFQVGGDLFLDGELEVGLYDLGSGIFDPQLGDTFDIFSAENIYGGFDLLTLALLDEGLGWQLDYLTDEFDSLDVARLSVVSASTVPVPAAVWLFSSGLLGLIGFARKRKVH